MLLTHLRARLVKFFPFLYSIYIKNQAKCMYIRALRDRLKAFAGHIWPAGRMLCMPALKCHQMSHSRGRGLLKSAKEVFESPQD